MRSFLSNRCWHRSPSIYKPQHVPVLTSNRFAENSFCSRRNRCILCTYSRVTLICSAWSISLRFYFEHGGLSAMCTSYNHMHFRFTFPPFGSAPAVCIPTCHKRVIRWLGERHSSTKCSRDISSLPTLSPAPSWMDLATAFSRDSSSRRTRTTGKEPSGWRSWASSWDRWITTGTSCWRGNYL